MRLLSDTNILSELARREPNQGVLEWAARVRSMRISAVTVEEILFGLTWKPKPKILNWFEAFLDETCTVLPVTQEIAQWAGWLRGQQAKEGKPRSQADMLIAATARINDLTLVTRNTKDFEGCGIPLSNPFS